MSDSHNLDKAIHEAKGTRSKEAGRRIGQALGKYNANVKKKNRKRFEDELRSITKYHEDRVTTNRTYHFIGR